MVRRERGSCGRGLRWALASGTERARRGEHLGPRPPSGHPRSARGRAALRADPRRRKRAERRRERGGPRASGDPDLGGRRLRASAPRARRLGVGRRGDVPGARRCSGARFVARARARHALLGDRGERDARDDRSASRRAHAPGVATVAVAPRAARVDSRRAIVRSARRGLRAARGDAPRLGARRHPDPPSARAHRVRFAAPRAAVFPRSRARRDPRSSRRARVGTGRRRRRDTVSLR